jgi:hypothetical protein
MCLIVDFAFPYNEHTPSTRAKSAARPSIPIAIPLKLLQPVEGVCLRYMRSTAAAVLMPEAAVDEDQPLFTGENEIWTTRKIETMKTVTSAKLPYDASDDEFRTRVFASDSSHVLAAQRSGITLERL